MRPGMPFLGHNAPERGQQLCGIALEHEPDSQDAFSPLTPIDATIGR